MLQSCGIHRWTTNSAIMHATSRGPEDEWKFVPEITQNRSEIEPIFPIFSHEPAVVRTPEDTLALFFTYYPNGTAADCPTCNCSDGNSYSGGSECSIECGCGENKTLYSYFSTAPGPYGPWSKPVSLCAVQTSDEGNGTCHKEAGRIDTNLSPVIFPSGELLAWTRWDIWTSDVWSDPRHYRNTGEAPDFSKGVPWEGEDPSMWVDSLGIFHILSHNGERGQNFSKNESHDCGRHFFSNTGKAGSWRVAPLLPKEDLGGCAYPRTVEFHTPEGLKYYTFYRRERPHLIFGPHGEAIALSSSVIDAPTGPSSPGWKPGSEQRDASYTLVQPLNVLNLHEVNVGYDADVSIVQL
uniref:Uncharacterized protein n=1 Tax=Amorphochlora amoebiformis TaxID=1561963 RepID=A0A7S0DEJ3_9EUKA